ncbi:MAG: transposase [Gammaproteobacteria bacterium]|nr:transposase [Gammaproteobacteria bacterium]
MLLPHQSNTEFGNLLFCRPLVRETAKEKAEVVNELQGVRKSLLPGYRVKMLDGNCIEASEHRLDVLRETRAGALPGKSLVVYDPALEMAIDVFPCEDGHAQERSLLGQLLPTIEPSDVWIMDRNFCVRAFLLTIDDNDSYFICREHKGLKWEASGREIKVGKTGTGTLYEHWVSIIDDFGKSRQYRRIRLCLNSETRDSEKEIVILTNLTKTTANAKLIAELYRKRWRIETLFQELEAHLHSEVNTLGYPKAALFGFCVALVAYNVLAVVKATLRVQHGEEKIEKEVSGYYLAGNIARTYDGMMVALPDKEWIIFQAMPLFRLAEVLLQLGSNVTLSKFMKSRRGPKKPLVKRNKYSKHPHVSTAKLLRGEKPNE